MMKNLSIMALMAILIAAPAVPLGIVLGDTVKGPADDNGKKT